MSEIEELRRAIETMCNTPEPDGESHARVIQAAKAHLRHLEAEETLGTPYRATLTLKRWRVELTAMARMRTNVYVEAVDEEAAREQARAQEYGSHGWKYEGLDDDSVEENGVYPAP